MSYQVDGIIEKRPSDKFFLHRTLQNASMDNYLLAACAESLKERSLLPSDWHASLQRRTQPALAYLIPILYCFSLKRKSR
jgi:hypothetical protein